ncbi:hypothetical protein BSKO_06966 [Bryopsis sp. KO-2023]|nr:hypothetical protein BSKO_06966 [Bryopsis sp. KO-2023]
MFSVHAAGCRFLPLGRNVRREFARRLCGPRFSAPQRCAASTTTTVETPNDTATTSSAAPAPPFKAFIDFKFIQENLELVKKNCESRKVQVDCDAVAKLYDEYVQIKMECDKVRQARNDNSKSMKGKLEPEQRQVFIQKGQDLKDELAVLESKLASVENRLQIEGQRVPNLTHPDSPSGGEENAALIKEVGSPPNFAFPEKNHVDLGEALDLVDFDSGAVVSGSKFYYLKNAAAMLEMALVNYAFQKVVGRGFTPIMTPDLVRESVLEKCGFRPRADNTQVYGVRDSDLCLTGTAEVPIGGMFMDKTVEESELPIKVVAYGHCFRTEAGAGGTAGKGLYRVHQFSKVEMFVLSTPEQSEQMLKELIDLEEELFTELGLHFKILDMPSGDLGAPAYRKYDIEAWMPGLNRYGEISSASNCTDFQSRRLNIRFKPTPPPSEDGSKKKARKLPTQFVHTLNATACAVPRLIVSILENFQQEDGSILIPEVLRPYMGGAESIKAPPPSA